MQECHDNDKIEPHNHNEYPLLYKETELLTSVLGRFLECRKWNILVITWALGIFLIYMPTPLGLGIYIRQIPLAHVITITYTTVCRGISEYTTVARLYTTIALYGLSGFNEITKCIINPLCDVRICLWVSFQA